MTLITFKLRNKLEIDVLVNDELLLTITRPFNKIVTNDLSDIIHFDLLDGYAEMYNNPNKPNSLIYYTSSCGNQMALILTESEANEFLSLTYENNTEFDTDTTETQSEELEEKQQEDIELQTKYTKAIVLDRKNHPTDNNYYIYNIDINQNCPITCVSQNFYKIGDLVNVDYYNNYIKNVYSKGILSEFKTESQNETQNETQKINSRFASWFGI